jgi:hypothetical protein
MLRLFLLGVGAIAMLVIGGVVFVQVVGGEGSLPAASPAPASSAPAVAQAPEEASTGHSPGDVGAPAVTRRANAVPPIPSTSRRESLGTFRRSLMSGLSALQSQTLRCGRSDASFRLTLETAEDAIRIVEATVVSPGGSTPAAIACVESALTGQRIAAPGARPGRRWALPFSAGSAM